ncbi:MAG: hypothetical protein JRG91_11335 [Deltaproteobacteria bacterium]|nr:hypothetical protein [Deltaproteobacteria bacterium]
MSTPRRLIPVVLALLVSCGGNNRNEGDADDDGDVVDEDAGGEVTPDPLPEVDDDPLPDAEDATPDVIPDVTDDDGGAADVEDDDAGSVDAADDDAGSVDAADDDGGGAPDASDVSGDDGSSIMCVNRVTDSRFMTTTSWTTTGSAVVNTSAGGYLEAGEGEISPTAVCDLDTIAQSFTLPSQTDCGATRLDVWLNVMSFVGGLGTAFTAEVSGNYYYFGGGFVSTWTQVSNCLGEAAHTGAMSLAMGAAFPPMECDTSPSFVQGLRVDNVKIEYDGACPLVGEATNGDLEDGTGFGWGTSVFMGGVAETDVAGIGIGGSYGARLHIDSGCQDVSMWVPLSIPTTSTMADPALSFQGNLTSGETVTLTIGDLPGITLEGTGAYRDMRVCLPHHLAGAVYDVDWSAEYWGTCGAPRGPLYLLVDNVGVVDDSTCVFASGMLDPGFEASTTDDAKYGWILQANAGSWGGTVVAEAASDATNARSGSGVAHLSVDQRCDSASLMQSIEIPAPTTTEGPAIKLWYRYPSPTISVMSAVVSPFVQWGGRRLVERTLPGTSSYSQQVLCLPPELAGRPAVLTIMLNSSGLCADYFTAAEEAWFDDFEVTTDSTCPTT